MLRLFAFLDLRKISFWDLHVLKGPYATADAKLSRGGRKGDGGKIFDFIKIRYAWNLPVFKRYPTTFEVALSTLKAVSE